MRLGRASRLRRGALAGLAVAVSACGGPTVDVGVALRVADVTTGWVAARATAADASRSENKLVPTISFRLDNTSMEPLRSLQVNGVFRRTGEDLVWGTFLIRAVGREGLAPGASTGPLTVRLNLGYTGEQSRLAEMLEHRDFVDVTVELQVKHASGPWIVLDRFDIERHLIAE